MDTVRVDQLKAGDIVILDGYKFQVTSIAEDGANVFGDPLFSASIEPKDNEAARHLTAHRYGNRVKWQGYLRVKKEAD